jgi:hypothetical protein
MSIMSASIGRDKGRRVLVSVLLISSGFAFGQSTQFKSGAAIYIEPIGGYETYLAAALMKEKVPVTIVTQKDQANYIVKSSVVHDAPSDPAVVINNSASVDADQGAFSSGFALGQQRAAERRAAKAAIGYSNATLSMVDAKPTQIVFAYSAGKGGSNQFQKTAEDCAKRLKEFIEKSEKAK